MGGSKGSTEFQAYVFKEAHNDRERLVLQHETIKPYFLESIEQVLGEYGLEDRLKSAKASGRKVRILDAGCAEGLYLHDLAALLEERDLVEAADMIGIDIDVISVETAAQFSKLSNPPRPYLHFYACDLTHPLDEYTELRRHGGARFDFIFALFVMGHLVNARQHILNLYNALKPGGIIFFSDYYPKEGPPDGWVPPHPAMALAMRAYGDYLDKLHQGLYIGAETGGWLKEAGAEMVQSKPVAIVANGATDMGRKVLRNSVMVMRNSGPQLVARKIVTKEGFDEILQTVFRELSVDSRGHHFNIHTLARKPEH